MRSQHPLAFLHIFLKIILMNIRKGKECRIFSVKVIFENRLRTNICEGLIQKIFKFLKALNML